MLYLGHLYFMNTLDLLLGGFLLYGIIRGVWNGFFVELASFLSLIVGIYVAIKFSFLTQSLIEEHVSWSPKTTQIAAFALTFIAVVVGITMLAKVFTKMTHFANLGLFNKVAGGFFGLLKTLLVLSVLLHFFHKINSGKSFVSKETMVASALYYPTLEISGMIYPAIEKWFEGFNEENTVVSESD